MSTQTGTLPSAPLAKAIARYGLAQRDFAALSGVAERTQREWKAGEADASWDTAEKALVALGLHWWDLWPVGSDAGMVAQRLWEGVPAFAVACGKCGLEDAREAVSAGEAERDRCPGCGGRVRVVVDAVAA
jgi:transcriptional regulator with XRE-family HTH domain